MSEVLSSVTANRLRSCRPGPASPLAQFVDCYWICPAYVGSHARERVLPTGTVDVVFAMDANGRLTSSVAGARSRFVELDTSRPFSAIGIHFKPGGGSPFFAVPINELQDRRVALDLLWGRFAETIADQLWTSVAPEAQFGILEQALLERGRDRLALRPVVKHAVDLIERSRGASKVSTVADRLGMSPRRFVDVFGAEVGLSPKAFCRIRRFAAVLRRIERASEVDWSDVAVSSGYFDQAHLSHDFRAFSGVSPSTYVRQHISRTHLVVAR